MSDLEQLEQQVRGLSPEALSEFREWFIEFDWSDWDEKLAEDSGSGKLDRLIDDALADRRAGRAEEI